ncbi:MAG: phospho-N-acetylmuramoyl-pentapeptide-transferase [Dethiosulfovibrio peptidovorans]|nr:MAG: phospho-N-acetylmuramoyl-pentapeptide-transferase [Dethiosulfovibrio peptidovorans]
MRGEQVLLWSMIVAIASCILQRAWINWLQSHNLRLVQKEYGPTRDPLKGRTPALGGLVFMFMSLPAFLIGYSLGDGSFVFQISLWSLPLLAGCIGLWDDLLKYVRHSSEGLSSLQKLGLQVIIAIGWSMWAAQVPGIRVLPGNPMSVRMFVPMIAFLVVSMINAVNVTDGLDGLAAGASAISFIYLSLVVHQGTVGAVMGAAFSSAFLWHNAHPARIFMGDCGSHFLGGLLTSIVVCGGGCLYLVPAGALFGVEILSVAIQIVAIRCFSRKIFLMSPLHHHFELAGWSEVTIVTRFLLLHLMGMVGALTVGGFLLRQG